MTLKRAGSVLSIHRQILANLGILPNMIVSYASGQRGEGRGDATGAE